MSDSEDQKAVPVEETVKDQPTAPPSLTAAEKGGRARAESLRPEERSEIARRAADARWGDRESHIPKATHEGPLTIADNVIMCAVLETRRRVLTQETFLQAIGRAKKAPGGSKVSDLRLVEGLPPFLAAANLKPFISSELMEASTPVIFRTTRGGKAFGYEAKILPMVCEVYLKARDAEALLPHQRHLASACDLLMRGFAHVGIIALVDEATGYQSDRARDELNKILEAYISKELLPWTRKFPNEFFKQVYRLHGWEYKEGHHKRPRMVGKFINKWIYEKLPPGVLPELRRLNPPNEKGYRKSKHFQLLTVETGHPHLDRQIIEVTTLMRVSDGLGAFKELGEKAFPGEQMRLALPDAPPKE